MAVARIILLVWLCCMAAAVHAENRVALVIGNSRYTSVPYLPNPVRDADAVAKALRETGFSVQTERDLGQAALLKALRRFEVAADTADWALIYYAGHGIEVGGTNYLVPVDAKLESDRDIDEEAVSLATVQKRLEGAHKIRLVILDACRNNPFTAMKRTQISRSVGRGLARPDLPQAASLVAFAADSGQIAQDGEAGSTNSPYATALVKNLGIPDTEVNLFFRRVRADVLRATGNKQVPATYESLPEERFVIRPAMQAKNIEIPAELHSDIYIDAPDVDLDLKDRQIITRGYNIKITARNINSSGAKIVSDIPSLPQASPGDSGLDGADGVRGSSGGNGTSGKAGSNAGQININAKLFKGNLYIDNSGGQGQHGGDGGQGGNGGATPRGRAAQFASGRCLSSVGQGGSGGDGGAGGYRGVGGDGGGGGSAFTKFNSTSSLGNGIVGGDGGNGGNGGDGGDGGSVFIRVNIIDSGSAIHIEARPGNGGNGGAGGNSGKRGSGEPCTKISSAESGPVVKAGRGGHGGNSIIAGRITVEVAGKSYRDSQISLLDYN